jgi:hypothetical protein
MLFYPLKPHEYGPSYGVCWLIAGGLVPRFPLGPLLDGGFVHLVWTV